MSMIQPKTSLIVLYEQSPFRSFFRKMGLRRKALSVASREVHAIVDGMHKDSSNTLAI